MSVAPGHPVEHFQVCNREFSTTILLPGFGADPVITGRIVSKALEICPVNQLRLKKLTIQRGSLELAGEYDPKKIVDHKAVQMVILKVGTELARVLRSPSASPDLPRSAEG